MWENIAGAKRYFRPRGFNIAGASAPLPPPFRRLWSFVVLGLALARLSTCVNCGVCIWSWDPSITPLHDAYCAPFREGFVVRSLTCYDQPVY